MKHTKEPWEVIAVDDMYEIHSKTAGHEVVWSIDSIDNAQRIALCINACAGMKNPIEEIAELRKQLVWHDATKETPKESGRYLIVYKQGGVVREFVADYDIFEEWLSLLENVEIVKWLPIPKEATDDD